jgi:2-keto-4-pentenoate hydratase/2-oxohepta-3-ene-1,7-dioic acid hydratase in catechol pathway
LQGRKLRRVRFVTYDSGDGPRAGILRDGDRVLEVGRSLRDLIAVSRLNEPPDAGEIPLSKVQLLPPIPNPEKIICIGLNYLSHAQESGVEPFEVPTFFAKFRNALVGDGAEVTLPSASQKVDYEAEVAFVIGGRPARDVSEDEALDYVAGYMLLNDLSARDLQFQTPQWMPGKVFDGSGPCGPMLVTPDEAGPPDSIEIELKLNGEVMQSASTADLIASVPRLVAHLSTLMTLLPGDIVSTGTPAGVGSGRTPRVWLKPGDQIEINSPTLGTLRTSIA